MFSRSIFGYNPLFVKTETAARLQMYQAKEEAKNCAITEYIQQNGELEEQLIQIGLSLETARGSGSLMKKYQEYFGSNLLRKVHGEVEEKNETVVKEARLFEEEINAKLASLDVEIQGIKREIQSVLKVVEDILDFNVIGENNQENRSRELDALIGEYAGRAETIPSQTTSLSFEDDALLLPTLLLNDNNGFLKKELAQVAMTGFAEPADIARFFGTSPTALLAENDEDTAELLKNILEREGFQIKYAADGYQAVKFIHVGPAPDLVILNMLLPYIDGLQLIRQIRRKSGWGSIPIIGLTVHYNEQETREILETGANDCVTKPFNPKELLERISRLGSSVEGPARGLKS